MIFVRVYKWMTISNLTQTESEAFNYNGITITITITSVIYYLLLLYKFPYPCLATAELSALVSTYPANCSGPPSSSAKFPQSSQRPVVRSSVRGSGSSSLNQQSSPLHLPEKAAKPHKPRLRCCGISTPGSDIRQSGISRALIFANYLLSNSYSAGEFESFRLLQSRATRWLRLVRFAPPPPRRSSHPRRGRGASAVPAMAEMEL